MFFRKNEHNPLTRIEARIERVPFSTCWYWMGATTNNPGYGQLSIDGRLHMVHRLTYEAMFGPIPVGKEINHLCETQCCCNPAHLEAVTHSENVRYTCKPGWGHNAKKTHCKRGHPFDAKNTYLGGKGRSCRACDLQRVLAYQKRRKAVLEPMKERSGTT